MTSSLVHRFYLDTDGAPASLDRPPFSSDLAAAFDEVARRVALAPFVNPRAWGGAHVEDPWPQPLPSPLHPAVEQAIRQHAEKQSPDRPAQLTFRTQASRSFLTVIALESGLLLHVRTDASLPLPADVTDVLAVLPAVPETEIFSDLARMQALSPDQLTEDTIQLAHRGLRGLAALCYEDLSVLTLLRQLAQHPRREIRAAVLSAASLLGLRFFLLELLLTERDPALAHLLRVATHLPAEPGVS